MKRLRPWFTLQGLIAVSIVVCLLTMLLVTALQGYRGARAVLIAPWALVVGSVGVVCGSKSSLSATLQRAANELLLFKSRENEWECV